jgi:hypothetical protein
VAHRKAVVEALQKMPDIAIVAPYWVASDDRPLPGQLDDLASCDLLISIVAWRYGYVPPDPQLNPEDQSLTELAFHKAKEKNIPRLAFLAEREDWTASMMDEATGDGDKGRRVQAWRKLISVDTIAAPFSTPSELAMRVTQAVLQWIDSSRGGTPLPR